MATSRLHSAAWAAKRLPDRAGHDHRFIESDDLVHRDFHGDTHMTLYIMASRGAALALGFGAAGFETGDQQFAARRARESGADRPQK